MAGSTERGYVSTFVLSGVEPLRLVVHDHEGDWQFLCGTTDDARFIVPIHAQDMFERYPEIAHLRGLPVGTLAERPTQSAPWTVEEVGHEE